MELYVKRTNDFDVTGAVVSDKWNLTDWRNLTRVGDGKADYDSWSKVLYSDKGFYFLFNCADRQLTCAKINDYDDIYMEDVVEVFLWPDEARSLYFEYEISPLGTELPILVPNQEGTFFGWRPWHYEGERRIQRATTVRGGPKLPLARVEGWTAEFFIPFELLRGVMKAAPRSGDRWRANMYRIDYDDGQASHWAWCTDTGAKFHEHRSFGTFIFGE